VNEGQDDRLGIPEAVAPDPAENENDDHLAPEDRTARPWLRPWHARHDRRSQAMGLL